MNISKFSFYVLFTSLIFFIVIFAVLGFENRKLATDLVYWKLLFEKQLVSSKNGPFVDGKYEIPPNDMFANQISKYIAEKISFITIDLRVMELVVYENGVKSKTMPVASKGKEGSFRETPSGNYFVIQKFGTKFSSVSKVWMPWSVQIYGNYFIHGMPYFSSGRLVTSPFSWGCIRLADVDAKEIYNFVKKGTPILISDDIDPLFTKKPNEIIEIIEVPDISAKSFAIFDFSSNEQILAKDEDDVLPIGYLTKLLTSLVASDIANLDKNVTFNGEKILALDLLPIMFSESTKSDNATKTVIAMLGEKEFMTNIQSKLNSHFLNNTKILEPIGDSDQNISNVVDLTKFLRFLLEKRKLITELSKESIDQVYKNNKGFLGGILTNQKRHALTAWKFKNKDGEEYIFGITILNSTDSKVDTNNLLDWLKKTYALE